MYQNSCPPNTEKVDDKSYGQKPIKKNEGNKHEIAATLYMADACAICDEVRTFLKNKGLSVTEKNIKDNLDTQEELRKILGAPDTIEYLDVPVTIIGDAVITGFDYEKVNSAIAKIQVSTKKED